MCIRDSIPNRSITLEVSDEELAKRRAADRLPGGVALRLFRRTALGELLVGNLQRDAAVRDVDRDDVAGAHETDVAAFRRFSGGSSGLSIGRKRNVSTALQAYAALTTSAARGAVREVKRRSN